MTGTLKDRYRGVLLGLAAGDALGTTLEFKAPGSFAPITDMVGGRVKGTPNFSTATEIMGVVFHFVADIHEEISEEMLNVSGNLVGNGYFPARDDTQDR